MKKVVVISSTPRNEGNSEILAKEFEKGALAVEHQVSFFTLRDYRISYCTGCYACQKFGKCVQDDDMNKLNQIVEQADVILFATPVYFFSISGQLKVFIDRLFPIYHKIKADIYLIATAWDSNFESTFESIRGCTRDSFRDCEEKGIIIGAGLWERKEVYNNEKYLQQAYKFGREC